MFISTTGQKHIAREAPGEGGTGGEGGSAHPVAAPWAGDGVWNVGEGDAAQPWHALIPEESVRSHIEAKGYANPAELAMANYNLTRLQRGDSAVVQLPPSDATPEQMADFYTKLGRPQEPTGYEFKFGDGVKVDDGMVTFAQTAFHEAGLTPAQAQIVADKWNEFANAATESTVSSRAQANDAEIAELQSRWGDDLSKNQEAGRRAVRALGLSAELLERVENETGSAALVELMAAIGRKSDEGGFLNGDVGGDDNIDTMTREQASAKIAELQGDAGFQAKYTDKTHPEHRASVEQMARLFART